MSNLTSRHLLVGSDPHPIDVEPLPLSGVEMGLIWFAVLVACVLAFHLIALASGGAW